MTSSKKKKYTKKQIEYSNPEMFVQAWQEAEYLDDLSLRTGFSKPALRQRAYNYRKHGVKLKILFSGRGSSAGRKGYDWDSLSELAASYNEK